MQSFLSIALAITVLSTARCETPLIFEKSDSTESKFVVKHEIFLEVLGFTTFGSVNYGFLLHLHPLVHMNFRIGAGYIGFPFTSSLLIGRKTLFLETTGGVVYGIHLYTNVEGHDEWRWMPSASFGGRVQLKSGIFFKAFYLMTFNTFSSGRFDLGGIGFGYSF